jgi:hypothetical protein
MNGIAVVLLEIPEAGMVTSLMVALRSGKHVDWCLTAGFRISSTWLTESQLDHWHISIISEREEGDMPHSFLTQDIV